MKKAVVLMDQEYQDAEIIYPYYRLQEAGLKVDLIGPQTDTDYQGKYGYTLTSNKAADEVNVSDYEVFVIPGGNAPDKMRTKEDMVEIISQADKEDKIIASICHGAQLLIEADVVAGKNATCYKAVKTDLINAGGDYVDKEVVVDENLITSRAPDDLPSFMMKVIKTLK